MSYCVEQIASEFFVPTENVGRVLAHIYNKPFDFKFDKDGNLVKLDYTAEWLCTDMSFMHKIAPYVKDGSYIHMKGEDGAEWKWTFNNGKFREVRARTVWDDE